MIFTNKLQFQLPQHYKCSGAGDVMYYLEFNSIAVTQQSDGAVNFSDKDKGMNDYLREGGPGQYSYQVEDKYVDRKKSGEGKDIKNNPYPLPQKDKAKK